MLFVEQFLGAWIMEYHDPGSGTMKIYGPGSTIMEINGPALHDHENPWSGAPRSWKSMVLCSTAQFVCSVRAAFEFDGICPLLAVAQAKIPH